MTLLRARAEQRFKSAVRTLTNSIPTEINARLGQLSPPNFEHVATVGLKAAELETFLENFVQVRADAAKDPKRKKKFEGVVLSFFKASYPFASLFLAITKEGASAVHSQFLESLLKEDSCGQPLRLALRGPSSTITGTQPVP
jgi:hypothetical protein